MTCDDPLPPILFFGNDWAAENRTSSHHIARWLAKGNRVYYIECPGLRAPQGNARDVKKIFRKLARFLRGPRSVPEGLKVWTILQLPLHRFRLVRWMNRLLLRGAVGWLKLTQGVRAPVAWFMVPHLSPLVGKLGESLSVYYCIDDYSALPNVNETAVRAMDEETTRKADLVFVASATLLESKRSLNAGTHVSPHGVDLDHFAQARSERIETPADIQDLPGPVIGFFGLIEQWIDLDLVDYLAEQRPDWTFVLVGRIAVPEKNVPRRSNIRYLGVRPYAQLPQYGARFDAAIIPYRLTRQVLHANPIKLREYLAMGKPIVSVSTPEIDKYADVVRIARTREEFLAKLSEVIAAGPCEADVRNRVERVTRESWDARLRTVLDVVRGQLADRAEPSTARMDATAAPVTN